MADHPHDEHIAEQAQQLLRAYAAGAQGHPARMDALRGGLMQSMDGVIYGYHASVATPDELTEHGLAPRAVHSGYGAWDVGLLDDKGHRREVYIDQEGVYFGKSPRDAIQYFDRPDFTEPNTFIYSASLALRHCDLDPEEIYLTMVEGVGANPFTDQFLLDEETAAHDASTPAPAPTPTPTPAAAPNRETLLTEAGDVWEELEELVAAVGREHGYESFDALKAQGLQYDNVRVVHEAWLRLPYAKQRLMVSAAQHLDHEYGLGSIVYKKALKNVQPNHALMALKQAIADHEEAQYLSDEEIIELLPRYQEVAEVMQGLERAPWAAHLSEEAMHEIRQAAIDEGLDPDIDLQDLYEHFALYEQEELMAEIMHAAEQLSIDLERGDRDISSVFVR